MDGDLEPATTQPTPAGLHIEHQKTGVTFASRSIDRSRAVRDHDQSSRPVRTVCGLQDCQDALDFRTIRLPILAHDTATEDCSPMNSNGPRGRVGSDTHNQLLPRRQDGLKAINHFVERTAVGAGVSGTTRASNRCAARSRGGPPSGRRCCVLPHSHRTPSFLALAQTLQPVTMAAERW